MESLIVSIDEYFVGNLSIPDLGSVSTIDSNGKLFYEVKHSEIGIRSGTNFAGGALNFDPTSTSSTSNLALVYLNLSDSLSGAVNVRSARPGDVIFSANNSFVAKNLTESGYGIARGEVFFGVVAGGSLNVSAAMGSAYLDARDSTAGKIKVTGGTSGGAYALLKNTPTISGLTFTKIIDTNDYSVNGTLAKLTVSSAGSQTTSQVLAGLGDTDTGSLSDRLTNAMASFFSNEYDESEESFYYLNSEPEDIARYFYQKNGDVDEDITLGAVAMVSEQFVGAIAVTAQKGLAVLVLADVLVANSVAGSVSEGEDFIASAVAPAAVSVTGERAVLHAEGVIMGALSINGAQKINLYLVDSLVAKTIQYSLDGEIVSFAGETISVTSQNGAYSAEIVLNDTYFKNLNLSEVTGSSKVSIIFDGAENALTVSDRYNPEIALKASNGKVDYIELIETVAYEGKYLVTGFELGTDRVTYNGIDIEYSTVFSFNAIKVVGVNSIEIDFLGLG